MSMIGELNYFLGLQICQSDSSILISQSKNAKNLVKKFGLESASSVRTTMSPNVKLIVDLLGKSVDHSLYRSMIGSLLYLTASRPDISYSVRVCARYQANPKESHLIAVKRIIKYELLVTLGYGMTKILMMFELDILMRTGLGMLMTRKVFLVGVFT